MLDFITIHIENNLIHCINDNHVNDIDADIVDCTGKFVIPGLIDTHIHFFQSAGLYTRPDGLDLRHIRSYEAEITEIRSNIPNLFKRYLACGVTGIIDAGGPFWNAEVAKQSKELLAPNVAWAGPLVSTVSREKLDIGDPPIIKAEDEAHARELVQKCAAASPQFIKFWFIYQEDRFEQDSEIMKAGMDEGSKFEQPIMVHATELETAKRSIKYGANILVHSVFDEDIDQEFIDLVIDNDVIYIPTLIVRRGYQEVYRTRLDVSPFEQEWGDPVVFTTFRDLMTIPKEEIPKDHQSLLNEYEGDLPDLTRYTYANLRRLVDAGATITTGTDAGNVGTLHGPSLHEEMKAMVEAGMDPVDVLISTTKNGADLLGIDGGEITSGKVGDLVIIESNPLEKIEHSRDIMYILYRNKLYQPDNLISPTSPDMIVDQQLQAYNARDIELFLNTYHPRVRIYDLTTGKLRMKGLNEMKKSYIELFESSPDLQAKIQNRIIQGQLVIDHEQVLGFRGDNTVNAVAIYEVKNHLITRVWFGR